MKNIGKKTVVAGALVALATAIGFAAATQGGGATSSKTSETGVATNENGSVSRTFVESTVSTNGNMVTEHRRETRTTVDADGNMLASTTSEYAQSYPVGATSITVEDGSPSLVSTGAEAAKPVETDSFLGLKFGEAFKDGEFVSDASEPTLLRTTFKPKKALAGFDDYYVYVTPKTHKVVKVYACAKKAVEPGMSWRRHYLIEALEKRYQTWARPRSWCRPLYSFDLGAGRHVTVCLADSSPDYQTIVAAWDENLCNEAADETELLREEARKSAAARRNARVTEAADAF